MYKFVVEGSELITPTTILLTARRADSEPRLFSYQPGQYAAIGFKKHFRPTAARCFSLASSPTNQSHIQFGVRVKGKFTKALLSLKPGDELDVRGPFGGFVFDAERDKEAVLLAGGIGISPLLGMARFAADTQLPNPITLFYSCHSADDLPFAPEIHALEKQNENFEAYYAIGEGLPEGISHPRVCTGRISEEFIEQAIGKNWQKKTFFICGPTPFMKAMASMLKSNGVPQKQIMTEAFGQGSTKQTGKIRSWPFNIYALSAAGLAAGSFAVMTSDLLKILPSESVLDPNHPSRMSKLTNNRQADLDALVNNLPESTSTAPPTSAVTQALTDTTQQQTPAQTAAPTTPTPSTTTPTPTPAPAPTPTPTPKPKCTTTQSGVVIC